MKKNIVAMPPGTGATRSGRASRQSHTRHVRVFSSAIFLFTIRPRRQSVAAPRRPKLPGGRSIAKNCLVVVCCIYIYKTKIRDLGSNFGGDTDFESVGTKHPSNCAFDIGSCPSSKVRVL